MKLTERLHRFAKENQIESKGHLSLALVVTRQAKKRGLPLNPEKMLTRAGGQVMGLGMSAVQSILKDHGLAQVLAKEGGRTSRGNVGRMRKYVAFLNDLHAKGQVDLESVERWWIHRVREFFAGKHFVFHFDSSKSLRAAIKDLFLQAERRQAQLKGSTFVGTMLQHLVGAKLNLLLDTPVEHHGAAVADEVSGRGGDFLIEDVVIHVTTAPTEALIRKCGQNLSNGLRPLIITTEIGCKVAEGLADQSEISDRLDIFEAEQFLAGNLYEIGKFCLKGRKATAEVLVSEYNKIIDECETNPSLKIDIG